MTTRINISSDRFLADAVDKLRRGYEDLAKSLAEKLPLGAPKTSVAIRLHGGRWLTADGIVWTPQQFPDLNNAWVDDSVRAQLDSCAVGTIVQFNPQRHTPGPWEVEDDTTIRLPGGVKRSFDLVSATGSQVADAEDYANARLIAAAPELLEQFERLVNTFVGSNMAAHGKAVALIKKIKWGA